MATPAPQMPCAKMLWPVRRKRSAAASAASPARTPSSTRPVSPIQRLSTAYLKKNATASTTVTTPARFTQTVPIRDSRVGAVAAGSGMRRPSDAGAAGAGSGAGWASAPEEKSLPAKRQRAPAGAPLAHPRQPSRQGCARARQAGAPSAPGAKPGARALPRSHPNAHSPGWSPRLLYSTATFRAAMTRLCDNEAT